MARSAKRRRRLSDGYSFAGFRANATVRGVFGDPNVRIVRLDRRSKKRFAAVAGGSTPAGMTGAFGRFATCRAQDFGLFWNSKCGASRAATAAP
jgi:hypothetical protein